MSEEVKEIKNDLDFAREVFDYTLNPDQCGLLLDYINQLEEELKYTVPIVEHNKIVSEKLKENQQLQQEVNQLETNWNELEEYIRKTKIKEFEKAFGKRYGKTFTQAEIIVCNMLIEKMQELKGGSDE